MAPPIKQLGKQTNLTPDQQRRRERDLIDQINKRIGTLETSLGPLTDIFKSIGYPICGGRCGTNGTGGISFSEVVGAKLSIPVQDLRVTFDKPRPTGPNGPRYVPFAIAFTAANGRFYHASSVSSPAFCELRLRNDTGTTVNVATTAVNLALFFFDRD